MKTSKKTAVALSLVAAASLLAPMACPVAEAGFKFPKIKAPKMSEVFGGGKKEEKVIEIDQQDIANKEADCVRDLEKGAKLINEAMVEILGAAGDAESLRQFTATNNAMRSKNPSDIGDAMKAKAEIYKKASKTIDANIQASAQDAAAKQRVQAALDNANLYRTAARYYYGRAAVNAASAIGGFSKALKGLSPDMIKRFNSMSKAFKAVSSASKQMKGMEKALAKTLGTARDKSGYQSKTISEQDAINSSAANNIAFG